MGYLGMIGSGKSNGKEHGQMEVKSGLFNNVRASN